MQNKPSLSRKCEVDYCAAFAEFVLECSTRTHFVCANHVVQGVSFIIDAPGNRVDIRAILKESKGEQ